MNRFLIIQTAFIGDVILATPVIEALHQKFPDASIDFLLRKGNEGLLQGHPYISDLLIWDKKAGKYSNLIKIIKRIKEKRYDAVINLQRFLNTGITTVCSGAGQTIGFSKNPLSPFFSKQVPHIIDVKEGKTHEIDRNLLLVKQLIKDCDRFKPKLYPSNADFDRIRESQPYITISPTSVWFTKQYPPQLWSQLIDLIDPSTKVFLLGGKTDAKSCEHIQSETSQGNVHILAGKLSFLESAALMKNAKMNYVNDSAPLHLASAMDAAVTAVFCSTVPAFGFGPLSSNSHIIETQEKLDCRPCGLHGHHKCPRGHFKCANINPKRLLNTML